MAQARESVWPPRAKDTPQTSPKERDRFARFLGGRLTLMAGDTSQKLSVPYPVLGLIVGIFMWAAGLTIGGVYAFATLSANVAAMNNAVLMRDAEQAREREKLERRIETQDVWIQTTREKMAKLENELARKEQHR